MLDKIMSFIEHICTFLKNSVTAIDSPDSKTLFNDSYSYILTSK